MPCQYLFLFPGLNFLCFLTLSGAGELRMGVAVKKICNVKTALRNSMLVSSEGKVWCSGDSDSFQRLRTSFKQVQLKDSSEIKVVWISCS